jgi:hypothetical protein
VDFQPEGLQQMSPGHRSANTSAMNPQALMIDTQGEPASVSPMAFTLILDDVW